MRALSIRQPWAWLIVNGHKDIENRDWSTKFRGDVLIHAGKQLPRSHYEFVALDMASNFGIELPAFEALERGGIVGLATIVDCVSASESPWFQGEYGFVISKALPLRFYEVNGKLGFFDVPAPADRPDSKEPHS